MWFFISPILVIFTALLMSSTSYSQQRCHDLFRPTGLGTLIKDPLFESLAQNPRLPYALKTAIQTDDLPRAYRLAYRDGFWALGRNIEDHVLNLLFNDSIKSVPRLLKTGSTEVYQVDLSSGLKGIFKPDPAYWVSPKKLQYADLSNPRAEVMAYKMASLLGLHFVPVTVLANIEGKIGSLQLFVSGKPFSKLDSVARDQSRPDSLMDLRAFDYLIQNSDRNHGNLLFDADFFWAIDHGSSFHSRQKNYTQQSVSRLDPRKMSLKFIGELKALSPNMIREALKGLAEPSRVNEIIHRREQILSLWGRRVSAR